MCNEYIGFHATKKSSAKEIILGGFDISKTKERDDHWLGTGIYFFQYFDDAKSWAIGTKYISNSPIIIKCIIEVADGKVLDLDNPSAMNLYQESFKAVLESFKSIGKSLEFESDKHAMHYGLDVYKEDKDIHFIKYTFPHHRTKKALQYTFNSGTYGYNEVQYCVSKESCIQINEQLELGGATC